MLKVLIRMPDGKINISQVNPKLEKETIGHLRNEMYGVYDQNTGTTTYVHPSNVYFVEKENENNGTPDEICGI